MMQPGSSIKKSPIYFVCIFLLVTTGGHAQFPNPSSKSLDEMDLLPKEAFVTPPIDLKESAEFPINPDTYELGPGDVIGIDIFTKVYAKVSLKINPQNGVVIPQIGFISTQGQTISSLENQLKPILKKKAKADSIKVYLEKGKKIRLSVYGAVKKPGHLLLDNFSRLTEALKESDLLPWAALNNIRVDGGAGVKEYDAFKALKTGDTASNPMLASGSKVFVSSCLEAGSRFTFRQGGLVTRICLPEGAQVMDLPLLFHDLSGKSGYRYTLIIKREGTVKAVDNFSNEPLKDQDSVIVSSTESKVFVTGSVPRPGQYSYDPWLSPQQYVSLAGGEDARGDRFSVKLSRNNKNVPINKDTVLEPGDILHVSTRAILNFNEYLSAMVGLATLLIAAKSINAF
jgi:protein involved in polysaccharide export with SLBB domain